MSTRPATVLPAFRQMTELEFLSLPLVELSTFSTIQDDIQVQDVSNTVDGEAKADEVCEPEVDELVHDEIPVLCFHDDISCNAGLFFTAAKVKTWRQLKLVGRAVSDKYHSTVSVETHRKLQRASNIITDKFQTAISIVQHQIELTNSTLFADNESNALFQKAASNAASFLSTATAAFKPHPASSTTIQPTVPSCYFKSSPQRRFSSESCKFLSVVVQCRILRGNDNGS